MMMLSVAERVERIIGGRNDLSPREILALGQLVAADASIVLEVERIASQIRDLSNEIKRNRDEFSRLESLFNDKLASVLCDPCRYMPRSES